MVLFRANSPAETQSRVAGPLETRQKPPTRWRSRNLRPGETRGGSSRAPRQLFGSLGTSEAADIKAHLVLRERKNVSGTEEERQREENLLLELHTSKLRTQGPHLFKPKSFCNRGGSLLTLESSPAHGFILWVPASRSSLSLCSGQALSPLMEFM